MPGYQQQRLQGAARQYPTLQPIQKERFDSRIRDWAAMTPDQRRAARETFQGLRKLPPEKQHELRERWLERHAGEGQQRPPPPERAPQSSPEAHGAVSIPAAPLRAPALGRRLASGVYDLLLLCALVLIATFPFLAVFGDSTSGWRRHVLQLWVLGSRARTSRGSGRTAGRRCR
jgi:hypothetical protein